MTPDPSEGRESRRGRTQPRNAASRLPADTRTSRRPMGLHAVIITSIALSLLAAMSVSSRAASLLDDRSITVYSARDVAAKRRALIQYLWGNDGFPSRRLPDLIRSNVPSPVKFLENLSRVDEFRIDSAPGLQ